MLTLDEIEAILRKHKEELQKKFNIKEIGIFGSFVRVDILVEFNEIPDIFLLIDLEDYLKKLLHRKIDLVRKSAIRAELREDISREAKYI